MLGAISVAVAWLYAMNSTELPCDMMVDRVGKNRSVRIWVESGAKVGTVVPMSF